MLQQHGYCMAGNTDTSTYIMGNNNCYYYWFNYLQTSIMVWHYKLTTHAIAGTNVTLGPTAKDQWVHQCKVLGVIPIEAYIFLALFTWRINTVSVCSSFCQKQVNALFSLAKEIAVQVKKKLMNLGHAQRQALTYS